MKVTNGFLTGEVEARVRRLLQGTRVAHLAPGRTPCEDRHIKRADRRIPKVLCRSTVGQRKFGRKLIRVDAVVVIQTEGGQESEPRSGEVFAGRSGCLLGGIQFGIGTAGPSLRLIPRWERKDQAWIFGQIISLVDIFEYK